MQFWQNDDEQQAARNEQIRRETERSLSESDSLDASPSIDQYRTQQRRKSNAIDAFFDALMQSQPDSENRLEALEKAVKTAIAPSRGKPHHLKKVVTLLAEYQLNTEKSRKPALAKASKAQRSSELEVIKTTIATSLLAIIMHDMVFETLQLYGNEFNDEKQLNAQKLTNRITSSVQLEILLRLEYAGVNRKAALQANHKTEYVQQLNVDAFFEKIGLDKDDLMVTIKAMIEIIANMTGLYEVTGYNLKPSEQLSAILQDKSNDIKTYAIHEAMPMIYPPKDWAANQRGGRLVTGKTIDKIWVTNDLLQDWKGLIAGFDMPLVYQAINALQQTAWKINAPVLAVVKKVYSDDVFVRHPRLARLHQNATGNALNKRNKADRMVRRRVGADSKHQTNYQLLLADLEQQKQFWYPWSMDARGRLYPMSPWLNVQGDDLARGLLCFADHKLVLDDEAKHYLAVHGSQFVRKEIIKADLGLDATINLSAQEREQWIVQHQDDIIASAKEPLNCDWWLDVADAELWQFLAFCMAWKDMVEGKPISLAVMMDGTCNGLQHIAALTHSPLIAKQTNLTNNERPEDIYTYIKDAVQTHLEDANNTDYLFVKEWVLAQKQFMDRKIAKSVVIGFSYGSRKYKDHIGTALKGLTLFKALQDTEKTIDASLLAFIETLFAWENNGERHIGNSLNFRDAQSVNGETLDSEEDDDDDENSEVLSSAETIEISSHKFHVRPNLQQAIAWLNAGGQEQAIESVEQKQTASTHRRILSAWLIDRVASYLTIQFETVMNHTLVDAVKLMDWLSDFPRKMSPLATCWLSPAGFPVIQPKFKTNTKDIDSTLYGVIFREVNQGQQTEQKTRIRKRQDALTVNIRSQNTAIPPNFIHSLDASHLMMTVKAAYHAGIHQFAMVHDSYGTHAADAPRLARILRTEFVNLHKQPLLDLFQRWFDETRLALQQNAVVSGEQHLEQIQSLLLAWINRYPELKEGIKKDNDSATQLPYSQNKALFVLSEVEQARYFFS